jgi:hypothetical protein
VIEKNGLCSPDQPRADWNQAVMKAAVQSNLVSKEPGAAQAEQCQVSSASRDGVRRPGYGNHKPEWD